MYNTILMYRYDFFIYEFRSNNRVIDYLLDHNRIKEKRLDF